MVQAEPERILWVQTSFLGDVILSTPVLAGIASLYPDAHCYSLTTPLAAELLTHEPLLKGRLIFDKNSSERSVGALLRKARELHAMKFSRAYVLQRSYRTALLMRLVGIPRVTGFFEAAWSFLYGTRVRRSGYGHEVLRNLCILGAERDLESFSPELRLFSPQQKAVNPVVAALTNEEGKYVVLVPGSVWATKRWNSAGYRELNEQLLADRFRVLVLGSKAESAVCEEVTRGTAALNLCGETTIGDMLFSIKHAAGVVCNDSMSLHVASAFKIPTVAVFCSTSPEFGFGPWHNRAEVVERSGLSCKPCGRHGFTACPLGTEQCMREVSAGQVYGALMRVMQQEPRKVEVGS